METIWIIKRFFTNTVSKKDINSTFHHRNKSAKIVLLFSFLIKVDENYLSISKFKRARSSEPIGKLAKLGK